METIHSFFSVWGGLAIAILGGALSAAICCAGSARGCGVAGEAGTGLLSEDPSQFGKVMIIQVIPGTQGLYGFVIFFLAYLKISGAGTAIDVAHGLQIVSACLPIAIGGLLSAIAQGRCAAAGLAMCSKRPEEMSKGIIMAIMVEFYAILCLLATFLMLNNF
jgi:V/A-type H+-transporting ATPase subunit K